MFGGNSNKVEDYKVEEIKQKLDKVDEEKTNELSGNVAGKEDEDLNVLLKQLTRYLENK